MESPQHAEIIAAMQAPHNPDPLDAFALRDRVAALVWAAWCRTNRTRSDPVVRVAIMQWANLPGGPDPDEIGWVQRIARGEPVTVTVVRVGRDLWPAFSAA